MCDWSCLQAAVNILTWILVILLCLSGTDTAALKCFYDVKLLLMKLNTSCRSVKMKLEEHAVYHITIYIFGKFHIHKKKWSGTKPTFLHFIN